MNVTPAMNDWSIGGGLVGRNGTGVMAVRVPIRPVAPDGPLAAGPWPHRVIPVRAGTRDDHGMQVIAASHSRAGRPSLAAILTALVIGTLALTASGALVYLVFGEDLMSRFVPTGRASTYELVIGALAWTFALTAPAGFGLVGVARLATAFERWRSRRPRITPAVRLRRAIGDDHAVATSIRLPDGNRVVPELVVGPFGAAVIVELPPAGAIVSRGARTWEVRVGNGRIRTIESPLERAAGDANRVQSWLTPDDSDYVLKVYAAVVGTDPDIDRTPSCAALAPTQVVDWLSSLPPQKSFDASRRDRVLKELRAAL